jgi:outer membrane protein OmpA-like peptidoglycan-associated protein
MNRKFLAIAAMVALSVMFTTGCASKKYVRQQTQPIIDKTNELDELTARTTKEIRDVDSRAQSGIQAAQTKATEADQKALVAGKTADEAQTLASNAATRVNSLTNVVANLDNYRPVVETTVHFGFDQDHLTKKAKAALDQLAAEVPNTKHYIIVVEGNTDSVGDSEYNYGLSQRRAASVIQYLAAEHQVPGFKIYEIGLGKDKAAAPNANSRGRAKNRRVEVRLMTNIAEGEQAAETTPPGMQ